MPEYKFVVHFKSPIPDDFDAAVLVEPVTNWIQEIDRGVWSGGYAIYEDQEVSFELCLLEGPQDKDDHGLLFYVAPLCTERVLRHTIPKIVHTATTETKPKRPTVLLMLADEPWAWNTSMLLSVLYGRCTFKTVHENTDVDHQFVLSDLSLFASDVAKDIAAIWWIEPRLGAVSIAGVSHRNPWFSGKLPRFVGPEYTGTADTPANRMVQVALSRSDQPFKWMIGVGERSPSCRNVS